MARRTCVSHGSVQEKVGWDLQQPGLVEGGLEQNYFEGPIQPKRLYGSMINYLFTVQSRFNQICFTLFLVKMVLFTLVSFFSKYANNKLLKKKGKYSLVNSTSPGVSRTAQTVPESQLM